MSALPRIEIYSPKIPHLVGTFIFIIVLYL